MSDAFTKCITDIDHLYEHNDSISNDQKSGQDQGGNVHAQLRSQLEAQQTITHTHKNAISTQIKRGEVRNDRGLIIKDIEKLNTAFKERTYQNCKTILDRNEIKSEVCSPVRKILTALLSFIAPNFFKEKKIAK